MGMHRKMLGAIGGKSVFLSVFQKTNLYFFLIEKNPGLDPYFCVFQSLVAQAKHFQGCLYKKLITKWHFSPEEAVSDTL